MTVGLVLAAAFAVTKPVFADERPPRYDLDGLCSRQANTPDGFSPETMATCLSAQGDALEAIRRVWPDTPGYIQDNCDYRAKAEGDGDYLILGACVRAQTLQKQANEGGLTTAPKAKAKPALKPKN